MLLITLVCLLPIASVVGVPLRARDDATPYIVADASPAVTGDAATPYAADAATPYATPYVADAATPYAADIATPYAVDVATPYAADVVTPYDVATPYTADVATAATPMATDYAATPMAIGATAAAVNTPVVTNLAADMTPVLTNLGAEGTPVLSGLAALARTTEIVTPLANAARDTTAHVNGVSMTASPASAQSSNNLCNEPMSKLRVLDAYLATHSLVASPSQQSVAADAHAEEEMYSEADSEMLSEILVSLQTQSSGILGQIEAVVVSGGANMETLSSPLTKLNNVLMTAASSINELALQDGSAGSGSKHRRRLSTRELKARGLLTPNEAISSLAAIVRGISTTCYGLQPLLGQVPLLGPVLVGLDATLATALTGLVPIVGGVLRGLGPLLAPVDNVLRSLGLGLVASLLGI